MLIMKEFAMEYSETTVTSQADSVVEQQQPTEQRNPAAVQADTPLAPEHELNDIEELVVLGFKPTSPATKRKLHQFLHKYHLDARELKYILGQGAEPRYFDAVLEDLAKAAKKDSTDQDVRGAACYLLADGYQKIADITATLDMLNLSVSEYFKLMYPGITKEHEVFLEEIHRRCQSSCWRELREKAKAYAEELSRDYRKVRLQSAYIDKEKGFSSVEIGSIGKKAVSMMSTIAKASVGQPISDFKLEDLSGNSVSLADHLGEVVIVYFWSSSCGPCKKSVPYYREISKRLTDEGKPFQIISLSVDDEQSKTEKFVRENEMPFINCRIGGNSRLLHEWGVEAFPSAVIINREGVVVSRGNLGERYLNGVLERIF